MSSPEDVDERSSTLSTTLRMHDRSGRHGDDLFDEGVCLGSLQSPARLPHHPIGLFTQVIATKQLMFWREP